MEKKVIEIDVKASGAEQGFDNLEQKSQSLKARLKELKAQLATMDEGSVEFQNLAREAGELNDKIGDINNTVKNLGSDTKGLDALMGGAQAVTGAFAIGQGAIGMFGEQNEELEKSLMKVQSAMAMVQGVTAITNALQKDSALMTQLVTVRQTALAVSSSVVATAQGLMNGSISIGTVAMRVFNAVVSANPIFLLITAITAVVGAMAFFSSSTEKAEAQNNALNSSLAKTRDILERRKLDFERGAKETIAIMKAQGATDEELFNKERQLNGERAKLRQKELEVTQAGLKGKRAALKQAQLEENAELITKIQDDIKAEKQKWKEIIRAGKDARSEQRIAEEEYKANQEKKREDERKKEAEDYKKRVEAWKKFQEEKLAIARQIEDINNNLIKDETDKKLALEQTRYNRALEQAKGHKALIEALEREHASNVEQIRSESIQKENAEIQSSLDAMSDQIKSKQDKRNEDLNNQLALEPVKVEISKQQLVRDEWEKKSTQDKTDMMYNATKGTLDAISSITELFAGKSKEQQRKAFKVQKGIQIAGAIIDTYKSANAAFQSMAGIPYVGPVLGGIAAAGAVAAGIINVKKISATQFDEGGGTPSVSGGGASAPNMNVGSNAPQFSIQGASGVNQLANTVNAQQPVKAYVVSSEMTSAQSLERNKIENATL